MKTFQASSPNVEVNGETVYSIVDAMGVFRTKATEILNRNGINNPKPGDWYKQQDWLNAFQEIATQLGAATLYNIGQKIPDNAKFPPEIKEIHQALGIIDVAYKMNHRGGSIGEYKYEKTGEKSAKVVCTNPYPDDFDKGLITAMARKFKPATSTMINVSADTNQPSRAKGADSTVFLVNW